MSGPGTNSFKQNINGILIKCLYDPTSEL